MTPPILPGCEPRSEEGGPHGALVLHGFTSCPQTVQPLAEAFVAAGYAVEVPLLPGHGTIAEDLAATAWADWSRAADAAYRALAARCDRVVLAGLSMGGSLAVWLASRHPEVAGLVCVNPAVRVDDDMSGALRALVEAGEETIPSIGGDLADPEAHEVAYDQVPLRSLLSMADALPDLQAALGQVTCPLLLLTSPQDHVVPPANSDQLAAGVAGPVERVTLERSYHVATLDHDRDVVAARAVAFAARVTG